MKTWQPKLSESWREIVIQKIWDQWVSIGGSGAGKPRPNQEPVDPEALVLVTTSLGMEEPRLAEMCFDWLSKNGKLVSVQRLKNIQRATHLGDEGWLRELAEFMVERKFVSWKSIANSISDPLIVKESRQFSVRSMSQKPLSTSAESFIFKLRNFFGMTARAEVFHWLLTHESGHASAIARDTFWLPKTVQNILNEWENAGIVSVQAKQREKVFRLDASKWEFLIRGSSENISWNHSASYFCALKEIVLLAEQLDLTTSKSDDLRSLIILESLEEILSDLEKCNRGWIFRDWKTEMKAGRLCHYFICGAETLFQANVQDVDLEDEAEKRRFVK